MLLQNTKWNHASSTASDSAVISKDYPSSFPFSFHQKDFNYTQLCLQNLLSGINFNLVRANPGSINPLGLKYNESLYWFVLEFCNGGDLEEYLLANNRPRKLDETAIRILLRQLSSALYAMHRLHITHRDLKPANILLSYDTSLNENELRFTDYTLKIGDNWFFQAPEVIHKMRYGNKVDVWSLGALTYECYFGERFIPKTVTSGAQIMAYFLDKNGPRNRPRELSTSFSFTFGAETSSTDEETPSRFHWYPGNSNAIFHQLV
ncbi:hypothetical protein FBUS_06041 [Fasciolopsis buskii]|uniref:Protein kinase domain-containing protein n=1 Tax=Fasciolopsis buskii TaxID=27845 RepID=A0A8E0RLU7_9TREM|nr:hypothetical protein FBUS_06041 [Fasciolopsis buski]